MKTKWGILAGFAAIALVVAIGCETKGGSSATDSGGSTVKPVIVQIGFGVPVCSSAGSGALDGAVFNGGAGYLYITPSCSSASDTMLVRLKVVANVSASAIDHYIWTIRNWSAAAPNGVFTADTYDAVLDTNGVFKVKTAANQIRYSSASAGDLLALAALFTQRIDVTLVTKDGRMASGYISLNLHNGMAQGDGLIFGDLSSLDSPSNARFGSYADYYRVLGTGATNVLSLEGDFDTYLALYDTNLNQVAANDDIVDGLILNSEIVRVLTNGAPYFVEATSSSNSVVGNYSISNSTGILMPVPNPFVAPGSCGSVAGTYSVTEIMAIDLVFNGQSYALTNVTVVPVTVSQSGCDVQYQVNDPTGLIPPVLRMGRLDFTTLTLYNDAFIPQSSDLFITASAVSGSGRSFAGGLEINSSGTIQGTFLGLPFSVNYTSRANFTR